MDMGLDLKRRSTHNGALSLAAGRLWHEEWDSSPALAVPGGWVRTRGYGDFCRLW